MYLHTIRPCAYRFTERRDVRGISQSVALCNCFRWGSYQTTEELSRPQWEQHVTQVRAFLYLAAGADKQQSISTAAQTLHTNHAPHEVEN